MVSSLFIKQRPSSRLEDQTVTKPRSLRILLPSKTDLLETMTPACDLDIKKFSGDGLSVKMHTNHCILEVKGDGCSISLTRNSGSLRITGDGCTVKVDQNLGDILYRGDGGQVLLGPQSSSESVKYVGDGGRIFLEADQPSRTSKDRRSALLKNTCCQERRTSSVNQKVQVKMWRISGKGVKEKNQGNLEEFSDPIKLVRKLEKDYSDDAKAENLRNDAREAEMKDKGLKKAFCGDDFRKETTVVVTKIISGLGDGRTVKNWFQNPKSVISSFNGDCPVKITSKESRRNTKVK